MPTHHRRLFIEQRARAAFREARHEPDPERISFLISLAETQLENVMVQRILLNKLKEEGNLKGPQ